MPFIPPSKRRPWMPERKPQEGRRNRTDFYNSTAWRRARRAFLAENPLCVECQKKGVVTPATVCDHIKRINRDDPFNTYGGRFPHPLDDSNFQGLCEHHHAVKSGKEAHKKSNK